MNFGKLTALASVFGAGLLATAGVSAQTVCASCDYRFINDGVTAATAGQTPTASYIGSYDPTAFVVNGDAGDFSHGGLNGNDSTPGTPLNNDGAVPASFTDWWIFQIAPVAGGGEWTATFNPGAGVNLFSVEIFQTSAIAIGSYAGGCENTSAPAPGALATAAGACSTFGVLNGPAIASQFNADQHSLTGLVLDVGFYAVRVTGDVTGINRNYVANLSTFPLPEPGSLALVALGLIGAGAVLRRRG